jgi:uncharacterized protein (DUF1501 family)
VLISGVNEIKMNDQKANNGMDRREFLRSTAAVGAGLAFSPFFSGRAAGSEQDDINVALLGAGAEGQVLMKTHGPYS